MLLRVKLLERKGKHAQARRYVEGMVRAAEDLVGTGEALSYILNELDEDQFKYLPQTTINYILREKRDGE